MSGSSRQILTGSWRKDKTLQIWDYGSGKLLKDVPSDYNGSMVCEENITSLSGTVRIKIKSNFSQCMVQT